MLLVHIQCLDHREETYAGLKRRSLTFIFAKNTSMNSIRPPKVSP
jgi:hypothetical protein